MSLTLEQGTALCRLLADPSRLRLLLLLEQHELSVAELTEVTRLAQSRVSTHLSRLRRAGLVTDRRVGTASCYSAVDLRGEHPAAELWDLLRVQLADRQTRLDLEKAEQVVRARRTALTWAETVAGRMELHYSPGRTWEATARALIGLLTPGRVLDIASGDGVLADLLAEHAQSVTCVDISATVLAAGRKRLSAFRHVDFVRADMHRLPLADARWDTVFLMHALSFSREPKRAIAEAARVLKPGGRLVVAALNEHQHAATMKAYDHVNNGVSPDKLKRLLAGADLTVEMCRVTSKEDRPPYFEVVTALARR